jgi:hypothetical protein
MRLVGLLLMGLGGMVSWYLGVKGEDLATLRNQVFAFFNVADPGAVLPAANVIPKALASYLPNSAGSGTAPFTGTARQQRQLS